MLVKLVDAAFKAVVDTLDELGNSFSDRLREISRDNNKELEKVTELFHQEKNKRLNK